MLAQEIAFTPRPIALRLLGSKGTFRCFKMLAQCIARCTTARMHSRNALALWTASHMLLMTLGASPTW